MHSHAKRRHREVDWCTQTVGEVSAASRELKARCGSSPHLDTELPFSSHRSPPAHGGERTRQTPPSAFKEAILPGFLTSGPLSLPVASQKISR